MSSIRKHVGHLGNPGATTTPTEKKPTTFHTQRCGAKWWTFHSYLGWIVMKHKPHNLVVDPSHRSITNFHRTTWLCVYPHLSAENVFRSLVLPSFRLHRLKHLGEPLSVSHYRTTSRQMSGQVSGKGFVWLENFATWHRAEPSALSWGWWRAAVAASAFWECSPALTAHQTASFTFEWCSAADLFFLSMTLSPIFFFFFGG